MNIQEILRDKLASTGGEAKVPKKGGTFDARLMSDGISVSNLGENEEQKLLVWDVFVQTIALLEELEGKAQRGNVQEKGARLGDANIPLDSVEGRIAKTVYKVEEGKPVFRRVSAIADLLVWAKVCVHGKGVLYLKKKEA